MSCAVVINALLPVRRWMDFRSPVDAVEKLLEKASTIVPAKDIYIIVDQPLSREMDERFDGLQRIFVDDRRSRTVFSTVARFLKKYEDAVYFFVDTPILSTDLTKKMLELHRREIAEYTYGEGFPAGYTPEIIKVSVFQKLATLLRSDDTLIGRESIFSALSKDINSFDIETYFAPRNLKLRRIELTTSSKANAILTSRVIEKKGVNCSYESFCDLIDREPSILRTVPSYAEIEITNRVNTQTVFSPIPYLKREIGDMKMEHFGIVFEKLLNISETLYLSFSYLGEPLLHSDIKGLIEHVINRRNANLILETDGMLFTPDFSDYVVQLGAENLTVIFQVDAINDHTYMNLRRGDLGRAERNIRYLLSKCNRNVYVQITRIEKNEEELLEFFDRWEKEGAGVIVQKYNSFLNILPHLSDVDLRPLEREPCWHLMRDIVVFRNGDVPRCKQDINGQFILGNLIEGDVEEVWKVGESFYLEHCAHRYDKYCAACDEYYTFNF
ncbi:MAG: spiro-SPASM protein [Spirochaetota bacterium]